jgi:transcriptional regulator with XRE-family HTH domain
MTIEQLSAPEIRRRELAEFLRSRRARVSPTDVGLPDAGVRRTPGLRREEVAILAGVGVTWYTWLEQGRKINPSDEVLASIARTLRLSAAETEHVFRLAREHPVPGDQLEVPPALRRLVDSQPAAAILIDARWDLLAWNEVADGFWGYSQVPAEDRNAAWLMFASQRIKDVLQDWPQHARRVLGALRAASAELIDDARFGALLERLRANHPEVTLWWDDYEVKPKTVTHKVLRNPADGRLIEVDEVVLRPAVAPELQLVVNLPV